MGCPTSYEGKTLTWSKGRLASMRKGTLATGAQSYVYTYNGFGQRIARSYSKLANASTNLQDGELKTSSKQCYYDHAGRLVAETGSKTYYNEGIDTEQIVYLYDESGIIGMEYQLNGATATYYFHRNLLGDVLGIYDTSGTLVAKYIYDAWGNCTISGETTNNALAHANPIRYRGYYYDDDTGLYYLNARYYSPKWRRFISPDDTSYLDPENVNGLNLYCYCGNDPINYSDPSGNSAIVIGAILGAIFGFGTAAYMDYRDDGQIFNGSIAWYDYLGATLTGGAIGAGIACCLPATGSFAGSSFSFGGRAAMLLDGTAAAIPGITATGAQILITVGTAIALPSLIMFAKGYGPRMGHNQHEKQMWNEAMKQLGIKDKDLIRRLHNEIHKYSYQDTLKGLIAVLTEILRKWGLI